MVVHTCNLSSRELDIGGSKIQGLCGLQSETLSWKQNKQSLVFLLLMKMVYLLQTQILEVCIYFIEESFPRKVSIARRITLPGANINFV
jgi:hypothetical protein